MLSEYRRALGYERVRRFHGKSDPELDRLIRNFELSAQLVHPQVSVSGVIDDPDDNHVLECAVAGNATHIVSGDRHLRTLGAYRQIPILVPRTFLSLIEDVLNPRQPD